MDEGGTELLAAVARVVGALDEIGVDYLVGGSLARTSFTFLLSGPFHKFAHVFSGGQRWH